MLEHITLETGKNPQYSIIWLHGLGADGQDFVPIAEDIQLPLSVRYIFPHAPRRPVTINGGFVMRAWYDITNDDLSTGLSASIDSQQDEPGIRASQADVEALIEQEVKRGIEPDHIFLAGFSQGGAIALHTALRQNTPLAGVLALSTYLPLASSAQTESTQNSRQTPIFMAHGKYDPIVSHTLGIASMDALKSLGYKLEWHEYPMQHSVTEQEMRDIEAWLAKRIRG